MHSIPASSGSSFLVQPGIGLMLWVLVVFGISMWLLAKFVFPRISEASEAPESDRRVDRHGRAHAHGGRALLAEYRERLKEARAQAEEIVQRARQAADTHEQESKERGQEIVAEAAKRAEHDIEAATKRALDDIRKEVADLTIMATEKVTRKTLTEADQSGVVEEALNELDFSSISSPAANN